MKEKGFKETIQDLFIVLGICLLFALYVLIFTPYPVANLVHTTFLTSSPSHPPKEYQKIKQAIIQKYDIRYQSLLPDNEYDLYLPRTKKKHPLIIWVHGGAYVGGQKEDARIYGQRLASEGYAVASINYQLAPTSHYPAPLIQLGDAIESLQKSAQAAELDFSRVFLAGDSAGGQLVGQYATLQLDSQYRHQLGLPNQLKPAQIKGILFYCTPFSIKQVVQSDNSFLIQFLIKRIGWAYAKDSKWQTSDLLDEVDLFQHIPSNFPPTFVTDGNAYSFEEQAKQYVAELKRRGHSVTSQFYPLKKGQPLMHEYQFDFQLPEAEQTFLATLNFLRQQSKP